MRLPQTDSADLNTYIQKFYGYSLDDLMAPVGYDGVGESVRHNGIYFEIKESRREDDATLPMGIWSHELKVADWENVEKIALNALCHKSKDLQLGVWLLESSIHRFGFSGIAPATVIIKNLCNQYWDKMHPEMVDGDIEYRTNPINWVNEKLTVALRLIPISQADIDNTEMCWNDWEEATRHDQLHRKKGENLKWDGPTPEAFKQHMAATHADFFKKLWQQLHDGLKGIKELIQWFDNTCGADSPSLSDMNQLLEQIQTMISTELKRRGINLAELNKNEKNEADLTQGHNSDKSEMAGANMTDKNEAGEVDKTGRGGHENGGSGDGGGSGPLLNRADAFASLYRAAEFLMQDDPHSPVPYLVYTACAWGEKNAPDLYRELFMEKSGQLNIFEMMGINTIQEI